MPEAISPTYSAPICLTPAGDDPPKADAKKDDDKKRLDQEAAAKNQAPATQYRSVEVYAARVKRDGSGREAAQALGAVVVGGTCGMMTKLTIDQLGKPLGAVGQALVGLGSNLAAGVVGYGCGVAGSRGAGALYDATTGGPNAIVFEKQTVTVEVPAKTDAKPQPATSDAAASGPKTAEPTRADATQPTTSAPKSTATPAPSASTLPYTPAAAPSAWNDPSASYLRADKK